jgi:hypothetical protein
MEPRVFRPGVTGGTDAETPCRAVCRGGTIIVPFDVAVLRVVAYD